MSYVLKILLWKSKRIRIDVQSIKMSFLGGRLSFKNLTYIDKDQTICALQGSLTWRYWFPAVRKPDYFINRELIDEPNTEINHKLPTRFFLEIDGLEIFVYNRTVSYDNIIETLNKEKNDQGKEVADVSTSSTSEGETIQYEEKPVQKPHFFLLKLLPISIKVNKGALVAGNNSTEAILVVSYASADGLLDVSKSNNKLDGFKKSFTATLHKSKISLKPNISFDKYDNTTQTNTSSNNRKLSTKLARFKQFTKLWNIVLRKKKIDKAEEQWKGLSLYLNDDQNSVSGLDLNENEYAKYTSILDAESINFSYYFDVAGLVPENPSKLNPLEGIDIGNGGLAPQLGLDIELSNATVHYGPWAERQRDSLHQLFFPRFCKDAVPQERLRPGQRRLYTKTTINIGIIGDCILRIPLREISKNKEFGELLKTSPDAIRPFGWIELKFNDGSLLSTDLGMVASRSGFLNKFSMNLLNLEIRTSVNHDILLRCEKHYINADIGYPLKWNGHACWSFLNESKNTDIFILKEHIELFSDMITDFSSGPPTPYNLFRPFTYEIDWKVQKYGIYFNVNDANIINNPLDFNDNIYLSFQGDQLSINSHIPLDGILKKSNTIDFNLYTPQFSLVLDTPPWHTLNNFLQNKEVGRAKNFNIEGSHTRNSEVELGFVDTMVIACTGKYVALQCYGFVVKYIMSIKENYFGDFERFRTLEEYTEEINRQEQDQENEQEIHSIVTKIENGEQEQQHIGETKNKKFQRTENEMDVHFSFCVDDSAIILPGNLYDSISNMTLYFASLDIDIRFTNYYMDMQIESTPIKGLLRTCCTSEDISNIQGPFYGPRHDLCIDGLLIHGHRMFGLPPTEPTYFCKWDITPGTIEFSGNIKALEGLKSSIIKLSFGFKDMENKLLFEEPVVKDTTCLNISIPEISISLIEDDCDKYIKAVLQKFSMKFNDLTNKRYSSRVDIGIENISLEINDVNNTTSYFLLQTSLRFSNFIQKKNSEYERLLQDSHTILNDGPFHRVPFFLDQEYRDEEYMNSYGSIIPSFSLPDCAQPLTAETVDMLFDDMGIRPDTAYDYDDADSMSSVYNSSSRTRSKSFFQDFGPDLKPVISEHPKEKSRLKDYSSTLRGKTFKVLNNYNDRVFSPDYKPDPEFEYDNLILNVGDIDIHATPESVNTALGFMEHFESKTMEDVLDDLNIAVLKKLALSRAGKAMVTNINLTSPNLKFLFGESGWPYNGHPDFQTDFIRLDLRDISTVFSNHHSKNEEEVKSLALRVMNVRLVLNRVEPRVNDSFIDVHEAVKYAAEDLEVWSYCSFQETTSVNLKSSNLQMQSEEIKWICDYINKSSALFTGWESRMNKVLNTAKKSEIELLYQVTLASTHHRVEHDPAVITKPAYIIRLSKRHIRANDSWKLIIRLRHILRNLPDSWKTDYQPKFERSIFTAPDTAKQEVVSIFSGWRSWEFADIGRCFIFRYVFNSGDDESLTKVLEPKVFEVISESFKLSLKNRAHADTKFEITSLEVSGSKPIMDSVKEVIYKKSCVLSFNASLIKSDLTPALFQLQDFKFEKTSSKMDVQELPRVATLTEFAKYNCYQITSFIDAIDIKAHLGTSAIGFSSDQLSSSVVIKESDLNNISAILKCNKIDFDLFFNGSSAINYSINKFETCTSSIGDFAKDPKQIEINIENISSRCLKTTDDYLEILETISSDIVQLRKVIPKELISSSSKKETKKNEVSPLIPNIPVVNMKVNINNIHWKHNIITPITVNGHLKGLTFDILASSSIICFSSQYEELSTSIGLYMKNEIMTLKQKNIDILTKIIPGAHDLFDLIFHLGSTTVFISHILNNLTNYKQAIKEMETSFDKLKKCAETSIEKIKNGYSIASNPSESVSKAPSFMDRLLKRITVPGGSFSVGFQFHHASYFINLEDISLSLSDFIDDGATLKAVKPYFDAGVQNTKFVVQDRTISTSISTVLDVNLSLKTINLDQLKDSKQSLHIESSHCRLLLHPRTFVKLLELVNEATHVSNVLIPVNNCATPKPVDKDCTFSDWFKFSSIQMLSYNACFGFIFEDLVDSFPGIIMGCEKAFVMTEDSIGKFSLIHAYSSIAKGNSSATFYSFGKEFNSPNRAFLPSMQVVYVIKKIEGNKFVKIRVTGEELDVKFVSSSVVLLERALKAGAYIESKKNAMVKYPKVVSADAEEHSSLESYKLPTDVTDISIEMSFAGGIIKLYRLEDLETSEKLFKPSFELKTPAVKIISEYTKTHGLKDHKINLELYTFSSNNLLYSTCVPVVCDIISCVKSLGRSTKPSQKVAKTKDAASSLKRDHEFLKLLSRFHIDFGIHIEKQELILSCEPSAKVQAVVGIEGIDIRVNSNELDDTQPLGAVLVVRGLGALLQHSYSREVSGSVQIDRLISTFLLSGEQEFMIYAAGEIENVDSYVNLKQLQDLDLFRDLWFRSEGASQPSSSVVSFKSAGTKSIPENYNTLVSKFQKVSTTNPIPWSANFTVLNVLCKVDLGQSLGVMALELDKFWAASRKKGNWEQNMTMGFNSVRLTSRGRLGGHLSINGITIHSVIQWAITNDTFDIPLVLLTFGFQDIQAKASFDYNVFLIGRVMKSYITVFNQVDKDRVLKDKLVAAMFCESIAVFTTALAASNIYDIHSTLSRIRQDSKTSYKQDLKASAAGTPTKKKLMDIINMIASLRTELDVKFGKIVFHIYPGSLLDSQVLIIDIGGVAAHFQQAYVDGGNHNDMKLLLHDIKIALSSYKKQLPEELIGELSVDDYVVHSTGAKGGTIFIFPSFECVMKTVQKPEESVIRYVYNSSFGGKVDIRWNLGSVNFIREMYATHSRALTSRLPRSELKDGIPVYEDIGERIKEVELGTKFQYVAMEPPVIGAPQLRDLGDATPPLEWFGLHRNSFPGLTHQYVIVGLQKLVHEVETQYGKILGKA